MTSSRSFFRPNFQLGGLTCGDCDIIIKSLHPVSVQFGTAKEVRLHATILNRTCFATVAGQRRCRTDCGMANPQVAKQMRQIT